MTTNLNSRRPYFILSCARSGSTSITRILDKAANGYCAMEPMPNLNVESRDVFDGRRHDVDQIVARLVAPRVERGMRETQIYGEKNVTYGPFVTALYRRLRCKFIFLTRDGREVVRSLLDWHNLKFGTIYRECREVGQLNDVARTAAANLPAWQDTSDYARPRPRVGERLYTEWSELTRFEMCAWYWATVNELYLEQLECIPSEDWILLDYTRPEASQIERVASFLGLEGLGYEQVKEMLGARINSLSDRGVSASVEQKYPYWMNWSAAQREAFDLIAGSTMEKLGYYPPPGNTNASMNDAGSKIPFGQFWKTHRGGISWYSWMYDYRAEQHRQFKAWFETKEAECPLNSIMELGCGLAVGYADYFRDRQYLGVDLAPHLTEWCRKHRPRNGHRFITKNVLDGDFNETADLVFSQGTIDNVPDMDAFLRAAVRASRKWIYITAYRGYFPELANHRVCCSEADGVYYNDISPDRVVAVLAEEGCIDIHVGPQATGREDIPYETLIVARRGDRR